MDTFSSQNSKFGISNTNLNLTVANDLPNNAFKSGDICVVDRSDPLKDKRLS